MSKFKVVTLETTNTMTISQHLRVIADNIEAMSEDEAPAQFGVLVTDQDDVFAVGKGNVGNSDSA